MTTRTLGRVDQDRRRFSSTVTGPASDAVLPFRVNGTTIDITEREIGEDALRDAQADLARAARLATMGALTTLIAHEVSQPLTAIVTNADACVTWLTNATPYLEEARRAAERIVINGHRAGAIIKGIRAFDILAILVERAGELVSKDELVARVWPNVFVDDRYLKTQVRVLRRALGEVCPGRSYVVAVTGRGYIFVAPVTSAEGSAPDGPDPRQSCEHVDVFEEAQQHDAAHLLSLPESIRVVGLCT